MPKRRTMDVSSDGEGGWRAEWRAGQQASATGARKADIVKRAREIARNRGHSQVVVRGRDGKIQTEWTYDDDPFPPPG